MFEEIGLPCNICRKATHESCLRARFINQNPVLRRVRACAVLFLPTFLQECVIFVLNMHVGHRLHGSALKRSSKSCIVKNLHPPFLDPII